MNLIIRKYPLANPNLRVTSSKPIIIQYKKTDLRNSSGMKSIPAILCFFSVHGGGQNDREGSSSLFADRREAESGPGSGEIAPWLPRRVRVTNHGLKGRRKADTMNRNDVTPNRGRRSRLLRVLDLGHERELTQKRGERSEVGPTSATRPPRSKTMCLLAPFHSVDNLHA